MSILPGTSEPARGTAAIDDVIASAGQPGAGTELFRRAAGEVVTEEDW
ncbi:hypothetical protein KQI48_01710 [Cellulomonas hominis]|nr:hypothetical protein [Cellulomonas hominis]MBU5421373.1 hypothetical protein [Cellulomonas hominis]